MAMNFPLRRIDPIFDLRTPLLFAHRGGAQEVPESTLMAFNHALNKARVDVLEIDVQLTRDRKIIVWHGPGLDNVRIKNVCDNPSCRPIDRRKEAVVHLIGFALLLLLLALVTYKDLLLLIEKHLG